MAGKNPAVYLADMVGACEKILRYCENRIAGWAWYHHAHMLTERQLAQVALRQLSRPTSYHPKSITVAGHTHGFHSAIVAAIGSWTTPAYSSLSGYWVLTSLILRTSQALYSGVWSPHQTIPSLWGTEGGGRPSGWVPIATSTGSSGGITRKCRRCL